MGNKTGKRRAKMHSLKSETQAEIGAVAGKIRNKNQQAESTSVQPKKAACEEQNQAQPNIRNMHQNLTRKHKKPEKKRQLESKSAETITKTEGQGKGGLYKQVKFPGWVVRPTPTHKEVCWVGGLAYPPPIKRFAGWVVIGHLFFGPPP